MSRISRNVALLACITGASGFAAPQGRYSVSEESASGAHSPQVFVMRDDTQGLEAAVAPSEGGELSSLRVKYKGEWVELIYRARDYSQAPGFRGKAMFLWPAVGGQYPLGTIPKSSCTDGSFLVGDKNYPIPCHGFAKTLPWKEVGHSADTHGARVTVELRDSDQTRASYPFGFVVRAAYQVLNGRLSITYTVASSKSNSGPMPFSIGNHIAYKVPFLPGTDPAAMLLETPNAGLLLRDSHGLISGEQAPHSFARPTRLADFDASVALALVGYQGTPYALLSDPRGLAVRITQHASTTVAEPLVRFNIYGGPKQGYLAPEPWFGLQNSLNSKKGLVTIAPGADWKWTLEVTPEIGAAGKTSASQ